MLNVWLEFLDERQQRDETVIMNVIHSEQLTTQNEQDDKTDPDNKTLSSQYKTLFSKPIQLYSILADVCQ